MKHLLTGILALLILSGCGVLRCPSRNDTHVKDSLARHVKDSLAIKWVPVKVEIPVEVMREIIPSSDSSHLETSVARSDAFIDSTGHLHHTLENKHTSIVTEVPVEEHHHSEMGQETHSEQQTITVTEYVEKELSWWQKLWLRSGQVAWALLGLGLIALIIKILRKLP